MQKISTYTNSKQGDFEDYVNAMLKDGWRISSTNCGFANSESYDFCDFFHAILVKEVEDK